MRMSVDWEDQRIFRDFASTVALTYHCRHEWMILRGTEWIVIPVAVDYFRGST
jgi:hypothetical protein